MKTGICLLVEDQPEVRDFFRATLESVFPTIEVVVKSSVIAAKQWLAGQSQSVPLRFALIDLGLPDGSGTEVIRAIRTHSADTLSIVITIYDDDARLFDALAAGASGYLLKDDGPQLLRSFLERIHKNEPPLSPSIARRLLQHFRRDLIASTPNDLTPRETETLTLISSGYTVPEAALQMKLSAQTVAGYVKIIYQKLHVSNRAEATREAIKRGLVADRPQSAFV